MPENKPLIVLPVRMEPKAPGVVRDATGWGVCQCLATPDRTAEQTAAALVRMLNEAGRLREAATEYLAAQADEARMREEYPAGSCNAEDAWLDYDRRITAARQALVLAAQENERE